VKGEKSMGWEGNWCKQLENCATLCCSCTYSGLNDALPNDANTIEFPNSKKSVKLMIAFLPVSRMQQVKSPAPILPLPSVNCPFFSPLNFHKSYSAVISISVANSQLNPPTEIWFNEVHLCWLRFQCQRMNAWITVNLRRWRRRVL